MIKDTLFLGKEAQEGLMRGITKSRDAVGATMGTGGSNALIEAIESPGHLATNDGATILQAIHFADPLEEMGKNILLEAVSRANRQSGDGSSTTTVLTASIIEEGRKLLGESPMELKRSLEACISLIEESIKSQTKQISIDEVGAVASISAEDPQIGATIQEIYSQIGKDGIIHWDISRTTEDSYSIGQGIIVEGAGYYSPYMCDADESGQNTNRIKLKNASILITKQKITSAGEFNDLFQSLFNKDIKDVVVFCDEIEPLIIPDLIKTRAVRGFRTILVKMPTLWKDEWYEDLALATGATVVDPSAGLSNKQAKIDQLGTVDNITVTKDQTFIDGIKDLSAHIKELEEEGTDQTLVRASRLNTKTARYFVGAGSDSALSYRRLKVEDAISASYQALHGGIVIGGGLALANIKTGNSILDIALKAPYNQIVQNMGVSFSEKDMVEQNVYDPANVVLNAVRNAISVAASVLTASTLVLLPREEVQLPNVPTQ
jgi:chaperonin GroEL